jgi:tripartite-type tricarboxylate transporter receptor subunit TctC
LGSDIAAKSAPDGYTLLAGSSGPVSISPLLQTVPYDPAKAFAPVSLIATVPYILVTHPAFPANNTRELIALVKASPGKYSFSSSGTGATGHLVGELFNTTAQLQALHIPYKGATPSLTDIMNGNVGYTFETLAAVVGPIKSGRLKALATSGARRSAALPDVPTVAESADMPDFSMAAWIGYLMPAGTAPEVLAKLSAEVQKAMQAPDLRERYLALGMDPVSNTPEELGALMARERERYAAIIKRANIKLEQ